MRTKIMVSLLFLLCCTVDLTADGEQIPSRIVIARDNVDYPPMEFHKNGRLTGLHVEMVNEVATSMGISVRWRQIPWQRALDMVKTGEVDGITYLAKTPEREKWAIFLDDNILSQATFSFIINKDDEGKILFSGDLSEFLKDRSLLAIAGFSLPNEIRQANPKIYEAPRIDDMLRMLQARMYEVAIVNRDDFLNIYRDTDVDKSIVFLDPPVGEYKNYIAFSKSRGLEDLALRFAHGMSQLKLTQRHIELRQKFSE